MPDKEGSDDEKKSTKSVVNKKQKLGEEGYDIARDMGKVRPSKDKKDATTMLPSKEMRKTQKVNKGPSALDIVKKKYKGQIMNVGKKKVKEELDLTQVAEAFGGYIIESSPIIKKRGKKTIIAPGKGEAKAESDLITNLQLTGRLKIPTSKKKTASSLTRNMATDKEIEDAEKEFKAGGDANQKFPSEIRDPKTGETLTKDTPPTKQEVERKTKEVKDQSRKTRGSKEKVTRETEFISDPRKESEAPQITQGKGDGRKAGRTSQERKTGQVTYQTFVNKPEVTGGQDRATDTRSSVYIPKPEEIEKVKPKPEKKLETKRQRNKRVRTAADKIISDIITGKDKKVKTQTQSDDGGKEPPKKPPTTGESGDGKEGAFSSIKKFARKNPVASLVGYDIGKGILGKIMNARKAVPGVVGGTVGRRSARGGGGL